MSHPCCCGGTNPNCPCTFISGAYSIPATIYCTITSLDPRFDGVIVTLTYGGCVFLPTEWYGTAPDNYADKTITIWLACGACVASATALCCWIDCVPRLDCSGSQFAVASLSPTSCSPFAAFTSVIVSNPAFDNCGFDEVDNTTFEFTS